VSGDPAREAAYAALRAVTDEDAYANLVLPRILTHRGVTGRDAAFATELTYGTLRLLGTLDRIIDAVVDRPVDAGVRDLLRLGTHQLMATRVPPHAAVSTTVGLARQAYGAGTAGFVNAVLRKIAARDLDGWLGTVAPDPATDPVGHLAVRHAHPEWIVRAFADALRGDLDATAAALAADNERPPVHLAARPGRITAAALAAASGGEVARYSPYGVYLPGGVPGEIGPVSAGDAHVQDEGSQLVALALAAAPLTAPADDVARPGDQVGGPADGATGSGMVDQVGGPAHGATGSAVGGEVGGPDAAWLDLCAGPGGKAALLGALAATRGATVTAVEVAPHRAELVSAATQGLPVEVVCADGRDPGLPWASFDRVLVDAPCTGLGALRRRPEARWRRQPADLPPLTRLQRELLATALRLVRPGGVVAYVTCSPHIVETQVTVTEASRRAPVPVDLLDARPLLPGDLPDLGTGPTVQLWPHRHGTDAMFLAVLRRSG